VHILFGSWSGNGDFARIRQASDEARASWQGQFLFRGERVDGTGALPSMGLRSPQIGAIHAAIGKMELTPEQMAGFGQMIARVPLGRPGEPEEIAAAALYFASDASRFTTGTELRVDGGITLG
jgi:NAD(P)-dependent dehydrogenase (short-subunit alcohol dehydrogenase family)